MSVRGFILTGDLLPDIDENEMRKMTLAEAYQMHLDLHKMWTQATTRPSYRKSSWMALDNRISAVFSDKFGAGWIAQAMGSYRASGMSGRAQKFFRAFVGRCYDVAQTRAEGRELERMMGEESTAQRNLCDYIARLEAVADVAKEIYESDVVGAREVDSRLGELLQKLDALR